nr:MAG TPA_asm: hypothetical protein [Caudoviricetes sp.]
MSQNLKNSNPRRWNVPRLSVAGAFYLYAIRKPRNGSNCGACVK